jgi:SagB-type dehydrogenase family enzyme
MAAAGRQRRRAGPTVMALLAMAVLPVAACGDGPPAAPLREVRQPSAVVTLPPPSTAGRVSLEEALASRRSGREFAPALLGDAEVGQLLWAAQGVTEPGGAGRTAPSAGGTYPLEIYALTAAGLFHYMPGDHALEVLTAEDLRSALAEAALGQKWVRSGPLVLVIVGVTDRTAERYGDRAERYVALEAGHAAQNVLLQAAAMGLAGVPVGAFHDGEVQELLGLPEGWTPLYLIPVGRPAGG